MAKKIFTVEYWEHSALFENIEAETAEEAVEILKNKVENGEVDFSNLELGDSGYEVIGEAEE